METMGGHELMDLPTVGDWHHIDFPETCNVIGFLITVDFWFNRFKSAFQDSLKINLRIFKIRLCYNVL